MKLCLKSITILISALIAASGPALAQVATWTGEGAFNAGVTSGNTDTTDIGLGLDLARETQVWKVALEAQADFGETDGEETKNRVYLAGQLDRQINNKLYGYGRVSYEIDEFSGFENRAFFGGGLGYQVLESDTTSWSLEGGPGLRIDEVRASTVDGITTPGETVESFSVFAASNFSHAFNENVSFTNDTDILFAEETTQIINIAALTAKLTDAFSARISLDVRHDTDPPIGFDATDTATRIALVYAIGG
ncbi:MAG: DUF481 domain-containing protein [Pseudomonadota bacterium]